MSNDRTDLCDDLQPQLAAYALGEASADAALLAHLAQCRHCQSKLRAYAQVTRVLPYAAPAVAPPAELRERILAAAAPRKPAVKPVHATWTTQRPRWSAVRRWSAVAFACLTLFALLGWNISLQQRLRAQDRRLAANRENWQVMTVLLNAPDVRAYTLAGDTATGHFWSSPQVDVACLVVQGLPQLAAGSVYQVWLMQDGTPIPVATFEPQAGNAWTLIRIDQPFTRYAAVGVTIEPRGGSATPTGENVLRGVLHSAQATPPRPLGLPSQPVLDFNDQY